MIITKGLINYKSGRWEYTYKYTAFAQKHTRYARTEVLTMKGAEPETVSKNKEVKSLKVKSSRNNKNGLPTANVLYLPNSRLRSKKIVKWSSFEKRMCLSYFNSSEIYVKWLSNSRAELEFEFGIWNPSRFRECAWDML